jgi:hypothetical protein
MTVCNRARGGGKAGPQNELAMHNPPLIAT